ncbi:MAG: DNA polymerase III subunit chi [Neisseriaceae bacterium]|nr:DNA polymerase III subunit chi [Neisseriaceae bacterium]
MPKATFYTHVAHRENFICQLARRVYMEKNLIIRCENHEQVHQLDELLWSQEPNSFPAHDVWQGGEFPENTPIVLMCGEIHQTLSSKFSVVLNLHEEPCLQNIQRVLEIIGTSEEELQSARVRFKAYRDAGFELEHHSMKGK